MKRDMELAREILRQVEEKSQGMGWVNVDVPGHSEQEVSYHIMLLHGAGLLEANDLSSSMGLDWRARKLTWEGHEFLDAIKNDTVWGKLKATVKEKGGAIPFEVLKAVAIKLAMSVFGA
jgi:hypothetical protein